MIVNISKIMLLIKKFLLIMLFTTISFLINSCIKTIKNRNSDTYNCYYPNTIEKYIYEHPTYIYAVGMGTHENVDIASKKAMLDAQNQLANITSITISAIEKEYIETLSAQQLVDYRSNVESFSSLKVNDTLIIKKLSCQRIKDGYTAYVLLTISPEGFKNILYTNTQFGKLDSFKTSKIYDELERRIAAEKSFDMQTLPHPSSFCKIPQNLLYIKSDTTSISQIAEKIETALNVAGFTDILYLKIDKGVALVTRIEQIDQNANCLPGNKRWQNGISPTTFKSLNEYIESLLIGEKGYYRLILFTITNSEVIFSVLNGNPNKAITSDSLYNIVFSEGYPVFPEEMKKEKYTEETHCVAWIYEFKQQYIGELAHATIPGKHPGAIHLKSFNFFKILKDQK